MTTLIDDAVAEASLRGADADPVDPRDFVDAERPQSWSRQVAALLNAGHYREAYEVIAEKVPYVNNQLRYFAEAATGVENRWSLTHARLAQLVDDGRPQRILDVGCAVGCHAIEFARKGHQTWGIDILPQMIRRGRELVESFELTQRVQLVEGDIRRIDGCFPPDSFDTAVACDIFEHLDDTALLELLAGLRKTVRAGGRIVIQTSPGRYYYWFEPDRRKLLALLVPLAWLPDRLFSAYVRGLDRWFIQGIRREPPAFYRHEHGHINCMDPIHLHRLLECAGLRDIRTWAEHAHAGHQDEGCMRSEWLKSLFGRKTIACRNVFGTATV